MYNLLLLAPHQARDICLDQIAVGSRTYSIWTVKTYSSESYSGAVQAFVVICVTFCALYAFCISSAPTCVASGAACYDPQFLQLFLLKHEAPRCHWVSGMTGTNSSFDMQVHPSAVHKPPISNAPHLANLPTKQGTAVTDAVEPRHDKTKSNGE